MNWHKDCKPDIYACDHHLSSLVHCNIRIWVWVFQVFTNIFHILRYVSCSCFTDILKIFLPMTTPNDNILWQQKKIANPMNLLGRKSKGWAAIAGRRHFILVHTLYRISYWCTLNCKVAAYFTCFLIAPQGHCQTQVLEFDKSKRHAMVSSCHKAGWSNRVWQKLWKPRGCDDPAPAHLTLLSQM